MLCWYIQAFALLILSVLPAVICWQQCSWLVDVTLLEQPFRQTTSVHDDTQLVSLTDFLDNQFEVKNMQPSNKEVYKAYPYYIRLQVFCGHTVSPNEARTLVQYGLAPKITITYDSNHIDGHQSSVLNNIEYGALIDLTYLEFGDCDYEICQPSWIIPLPFLYHTTKMQVKVDLPGHDTILPKSLVLYLSGYFPDHGEGIIRFCDDNVTHYLLQEILTGHLHYSIQTVTLSTASLLVGGFENSNQMILTEDGFHTSLAMEIQLVPEGFVCPNSSSRIKSVATLLDRLLFNTASGIVEVFATYKAMKTVELPIGQLNEPARCYKRMVVVEYAYNSVTHVLAISMENQLFDAPISFGKSLLFERVTDFNGQGPCQHLGGSDCSVISAGLSGIEDNFYLFLTQAASNYSIIQMRDSVMTTIPIIARNIDLIDELYLHDLSLTTYQSTHMFIWGNVILHSNDLGSTITQLRQYTSSAVISLFVSSPNTPHFAILNKLDEIWYGLIGDIVSLVKLKPSAGWSLVHTLLTSDHSNELWEVSSTVSVFYDSETVLNELVLYEEDGFLYLKPHTIPVGKVLEHHQFLTNPEVYPIDRSEGATTVVSQSKCPYSDRWFEYHDSARYERLEWFVYNAPHLTWPSQIHTADSLKVYQGIVNQMLSQMVQDLSQTYSLTDHNPFAKWLSRRTDNMLYYDYMYRNKLLPSGVHVSPSEYTKHYKPEISHSEYLPRRIFMDFLDVYKFALIMAIDDSELIVFRNLDNLRVSVSLSNYTLVHVHTARRASYVNNTVKYEITLMEQGELHHQEEPGEHLHPVTMLLQVWNSNFKCLDPYNIDNSPQGTYSMSVMLGCPPALKLVFDVVATLDYLTMTRQFPYDCPYPEPDMHCFYYDHTFHPIFKLVDLATGKSNNFTSDYTLTVIGGSETGIDDIRLFSEEEIQKHNSQESAGSLIWLPLDLESRGNGSIPIFSWEHNGIVWRCQDGSPCANVPINFPFSPEYYFLIEVSNWDVGKETTYCGYKMQFVIKVHGLQISFYRSLRIMGCTFLILIVTCGLYMWCKDDDWKNWKHMKDMVLSKNIVVPAAKQSSSSVFHLNTKESEAESSGSEHVMEVVEGNPEILKMITPSGAIRFPIDDVEGGTSNEQLTTEHTEVL